MDRLRQRQRGGEKESADKPGSVLDDHSSGTPVTGRLERPTRRHLRAAGCPKACLPIWSCSRGGLPCRPRYRRRGALLPHPFTLTCRRNGFGDIGGLLSVALSVDSRRPGITWPLALWSPDFPPPPMATAIVWPTPAHTLGQRRQIGKPLTPCSAPVRADKGHSSSGR